MHGFHVPPTLYSRPCWRDLPRHQSNLLPALQHPDFNSVPNMPGTSPKLYQSESNAGSDASGVENMSTSKRGEDVSSATCLQPRSFQVVAVLVLAAGLQILVPFEEQFLLEVTSLKWKAQRIISQPFRSARLGPVPTLTPTRTRIHPRAVCTFADG